MKKIEFSTKLSLNKSTVSKLSNGEMNNAVGGKCEAHDAAAAPAAAGFTSIGRNCTQPCHCDIQEWSKGRWCD